jgi:hypothetical protein
MIGEKIFLPQIFLTLLFAKVVKLVEKSTSGGTRSSFAKIEEACHLSDSLSGSPCQPMPDTPTQPETSMNVDGASSGLRLEIVETEQGFLSLEPVWDVLVERMSTRCVFVRWDWMRLWCEAHRDVISLAVAVVRDDSGAVRGIAPLVLGTESGGMRRRLRHLALMTSLGDAQGERLDFIVPAGEEDIVTPVLCGVFEMLRAQWDTVLLKKIPEESPNLPHLLKALARCGDASSVLNTHPTHYARLPGTYVEYEMTHSVSWRSKIRRRWRAMESKLRGVPLMGGVDIPVDEMMKCLSTLHATRWPPGKSLFLTERSWAFHQKLAQLWVPRGKARLPAIAVDGRPVSIVYGFRERDEFCQFQLGWDARYAWAAIARVAMVWSLRQAIRDGAAVYDLLPGEFSYKQSWCQETRHVLDLEAFNPASLRARMFMLVRQVKRLVSGGEEAGKKNRRPRGG